MPRPIDVIKIMLITTDGECQQLLDYAREDDLKSYSEFYQKLVLKYANELDKKNVSDDLIEFWDKISFRIPKLNSLNFN